MLCKEFGCIFDTWCRRESARDVLLKTNLMMEMYIAKIIKKMARIC